MISEKTKNALSKALVPSTGVAAAYYLLACSIFNMDKNVCLAGSVSVGIAVFIALSLIYRR